MLFIYAVLTFIAWGVADLFYKKGSRSDDKYSHLKILTVVGLVMGVHALLYCIIKAPDFTFIDIVRYLPVSALYILSMALGYVGLRYVALSVCSPIQNSSGAVSMLLLVIFFKAKLSGIEIIGVSLLCVGVFLLSLFEGREERSLQLQETDKKKKTGLIAVIFPLLYCVIDGLGTFADGVYLDELELIGEGAALVAYELTFFIVGVISFVYVFFIKKDRFNPFTERDKLLAAVFETAGQFFYVFAMSGRAVIAAPVVASYCVLSVLLSRFFLKEKLSVAKYISIIIVFAGIVLLGVSEGLTE